MDQRQASPRLRFDNLAKVAIAIALTALLPPALRGQNVDGQTVGQQVTVPDPSGSSASGSADSQPSLSDVQPGDSSASASDSNAEAVEKGAAPAAAADPVSRELQAIALQARKELDVATLPKVAPAQAQLVAAIDNLDRYLSTNPGQRQAWLKFLRLDEMRAQAHEEKPDLAVLVDLEMSMRQNYVGLDYQPYTNVRDSLQQFHRAVRYGSAPEQAIKFLDVRLEKLVETLNQPVTDTDSERSEAVGVVANYLEQTGQAASSVAALRSKFSHPNVQALVRESFVARLLDRPVSQPTAVNECLLGTRVVGSACLNGAVTADLLPSSDGIAMCLNLNANMSTNNTGYNRGVVLRSTGSSPIFAAKQIFVTPAGITSTPASVATHLQTQINSIEHRSRLVRSIATRKAAETQPEANRVAEGRLQTRVRTQFDQQVEGQLNESRPQLASFQQRSQSPPELARIGMPKPSYFYNSTSTAVHGVLTQRTHSQLAASKPSDLPKSDDAQIIVEAHQSAIMNAIDVFLGGRTLRNTELDDLVSQFGGKVTPELQKEASAEPWSITFATFHPIQVELNDGLIKLTLRIGQMTRGDQVLKQDAVISASYRPSVDGDVFRMDREGLVEIEFIGKVSNIAAVSMRAFLKGKFEETFKPVLVNTPIDLTVRDAPKMPRLQISGLQLDNGWAQVSLK